MEIRFMGTMPRLFLAALILVVVSDLSVRGQDAPAFVPVPAMIRAEGVPTVPAILYRELNRYQSIRSAGFQDWASGDKGMYITTRFADVPQVHFVVSPGGARNQLTFLPERVLSVSARPKHDQFLFVVDEGGAENLKLDNGKLREDAVKDIGALLDWIGKQPGLDKSRVAVTGGSYGGFMSLAVQTTYNDRIKAGIDIVGISNFVTFLKKTQGYRRDLRRAEYGDERDPEMRAFLERTSPLAHADRIHTPILVVQGQNDPRVPLSEAEQMVAALKKNAVPVWYLVGTNEGHGFAKKVNQDYLQAVEVLFLNRYLLGR